MATVRISPGTTNLSVNIDIRLHEELQRLAKRDGVTLSEYCRRILIFAAEHGARLQDGVVFPTTAEQIAALNETKNVPAPIPPKGPANYRRK